MFLIAGPCAIENRDIVLQTAETLNRLCYDLGLTLYFKSSFDKANRTTASARGVGMGEGLRILQEVKEQFGLPILTDVHECWQCRPVSDVADVLQIPAFLCRQTELLHAAARTGRCVNVKKGQFLSPEAMQQVAGKMRAFGCDNFMLTERGTTFGYQDLVVDFRGVPTMQQNHVPVVVDITHSLQQPNQSAGVTGGRPDMIETIARAAIAVGADGIFMETHPDPARAKSDGANMLRLDLAEQLLEHLVAIRKTIINL